MIDISKESYRISRTHCDMDEQKTMIESLCQRVREDAIQDCANKIEAIPATMNKDYFRFSVLSLKQAGKEK